MIHVTIVFAYVVGALEFDVVLIHLVGYILCQLVKASLCISVVWVFLALCLLQLLNKQVIVVDDCEVA